MRRLLLSLLALMAIAIGAKPQDMTATPLTLEAVEAGTINVINPNGLTIEYNKNGGGWTGSTANPISITVAATDVVQFRGDNETYLAFGEQGELPTRFTATNSVYLYGNVMSLISSTGFATLKELTDNSEWGIGSNLAYLFTTPESEYSPFPKENTTILNHPTKDIVLPATTLTPSCYMYMFSGCAGLTRAPQLPATTLADGCYHRLFDNCTSLQVAPTLPAKKLAGFCYSSMFAGCTSLNYVKCMATDASAGLCFEGWMEGVPEGGTFVKASTNDSYATGIDGIPEGWMVQNATEADGDMGMTPLTMEAIADGTFTITNPQRLNIKYKKNDGNWTLFYSTTFTIEVAAGDKVQFKAINASYCNEGSNATHFSSSADCYVYGNVMSLIKETIYSTNKELTGQYALAYLFANADLTPNNTLKSHPYNELVLPATTLTNKCYTGMFHGCQGITEAPLLPATTLGTYCYDGMFKGCTGLKEAPQLPAEKLNMGCYANMFNGCTGLTKAPMLSARVVSASAYDNMFAGCSHLNYVKCLATSLGSNATTNWLDGVAATGTFVKMSQMRDFATGADGIPTGWTTQGATEDDGDYGATPLTLEAVTAGIITISNPNEVPVHYVIIRKSGMQQYRNNVKDKTVSFDVEPGDKLTFKGNGSTNAYGNIQTGMGYQIKSTADVYVYGNVMSLTGSTDNTVLTGNMNFACLFGSDNPAEANTTIKSHPTKDLVLGATTLTESCYTFMFAGCQGLTRAPELPATELAPICYHRMFGNCTALTAAPVLPAPTLVEECYFAMFDGCSSLNYVKCLATNLGEHNTDSWLNDVAAKGTFVKADDANWTLNSPDGIPAGWITTDTPLTIEAIEDGTTVTIANNLKLPIEYSTDGGTTWTTKSDATITISDIAEGATVQLRGDNACYSQGSKAKSTIITTDKDAYAYGNVMSLVSSTGYATATTLTADYALYMLFYQNTHLKSHAEKELVLPATSLTENCYGGMFNGCTALTKAPALPATTLVKRCYWYMFSSCTSLATAPELPATNLAESCYGYMFQNTGLTTAPTLPATSLSAYCYQSMFRVCKQLDTAPVLPATTLAENCYDNMFRATGLTIMPELPATTLADYCYNFMFANCTSLVTTSMLPATTLADGCYQRMFNGCTNIVTAPELPATELADLCYNDMFMDCTALKNAPELPATTLVPYCYTMMFYGCSSLEKAPVLPAATLTGGCYEHMFMDCSKLNYVKCLATDLCDESSTDGWLTNVAATGTFVKAAGADWSGNVATEGEWEYNGEYVSTTFINGIPEGWTAKSIYPVTMPASGICTFSVSDAVAMPAGLNAYTCSTFDSNASTISMQAVSGTVIPAATGVLLRGEAGAVFELEPAIETSEPIEGNSLVAVTEPTHVPAAANGYINFMLSKGKFIRIQEDDDDVKMPANKAYLQIPAASLNSSVRSIALAWDETPSSVMQVEDGPVRTGNTIYDLQGRQIVNSLSANRQLQRGLYIVNGKKVFVK